MDLFGAATKGVDPQTGSYLSKEQRIAMFRASQGRGGSGGGASNGGVGGGARVSPQSSIVVVNKLNQISKSLQTNFTTATENVAAQVAQNRQSVENLYKFTNQQQEQELKEERVDTKQKQLTAQNMRFQMRERLIESISSAAAGAINAAKNVARAAADPMMGFLERLKNALILLAGAWLVKNLPAILKDIESMFKDFEGVKRELARQLINQRGWSAGVNAFIKTIVKGLSRIIRATLRFAGWIARQIGKVVGKIFRSTKNFVTRIFRGIVRRLKDPIRSLLRRAGKLIPEPIKRAAANFGSRVANSGAAKALSGFASKLGIAAGSTKNRLAGLKKILSPVLRAMGIPFQAATGVLSKAVKLPVVGIAIDVALNKGAGMGWVDSIINGLATGIAGAVGWKAGGAAGAAVGTAIFPGPGTLIGGALGSVLGSIIAANLAEGGLNAGREALGMDPVVRPEYTGEQAQGLIDSAGNMGRSLQESLSGLSTPEGLGLPENFGSTINMDTIELPTQTTRVPRQGSSSNQSGVELPPALDATDPEMDFYRALSLRQYDITY